jgi:NADPH-dependent glutamate synthase beta subunit-like oxidoreductase
MGAEHFRAPPPHLAAAYPLTSPGERAIVIGNGNVALDIVRILVADPEEPARIDIADQALEALQNTSIREIFVLGRRRVEACGVCHTDLAYREGGINEEFMSG